MPKKNEHKPPEMPMDAETIGRIFLNEHLKNKNPWLQALPKNITQKNKRKSLFKSFLAIYEKIIK